MPSASRCTGRKPSGTEYGWVIQRFQSTGKFRLIPKSLLHLLHDSETACLASIFTGGGEILPMLTKIALGWRSGNRRSRKHVPHLRVAIALPRCRARQSLSEVSKVLTPTLYYYSMAFHPCILNLDWCLVSCPWYFTYPGYSQPRYDNSPCAKARLL